MKEAKTCRPTETDVYTSGYYVSRAKHIYVCVVLKPVSLLVGLFRLQNELCLLRKSNRRIRPFSFARPSRILHPRKSNIRLYSQRIVNCPRKFTIVSTSSIKPGARIVRSPIETWLEEPRRSSYVPQSCSKLAPLNVIAR